MTEQATILHIPLKEKSGKESIIDKVHSLENLFQRTIETAQYGEFDGYDMNSKEVIFYFYAQNADKLHRHLKPTLDALPQIQGSRVIIRYGEANDPNAKIVESVI